MKILQNKFVVNRRNNKCLSLMIFYITTTARTAGTATATAAIMILMQIIVSVNTTKQGSNIRPDTEITTAPVAPVIRTKTLNTININPIMLQQQQQHQQQGTKTKAHTPSLPSSPFSSSSATATAALKASTTLNSFHMSDARETMTPPSPKSRSAATSSSALATIERGCKFLSAAWGDIDPNVFYICDAQTKTPLQLRCPEGTGFFLGLGYSGCIPYEQWPACLSSGHVEQVSVCDSEHMQQPWASKNPNKFYVCLRETIEPAILNCEPGKGFVHAAVTTRVGGGGGGVSGTGDVGVGVSAIREIVGCANWEKWRNYMHCNEYY